MRDLLPAIFSSPEAGSGGSSNDSDTAAGNARLQQQGPNSTIPSSTWGLSGLKDIIWSDGSIDYAGGIADSSNSNSLASVASPFASVCSNSKQQQQQERKVDLGLAAAAVADDTMQTVSDASDDSTDQAAAAAAAAAAACHDSKHTEDSSPDNDDSESDWEPEEDDSEDLLDSFQTMLERCWFGTDSSSKQQQRQRGELRSFPLPPFSPFQFSSTRTRQLAQRRSQQQQQQQQQSPSHISSSAARSASRSKSVKRNTVNDNSNSKAPDDEDDDSWVPSSWLPRPVQRALGRTESSKASGWHAKPLRVKMAEQVLGEGLVDALELVQRDILDSEDPLPEATIKFFVKAGVGVATGWVSAVDGYKVG
jgi:hypothetical protein